MRSPDRVASLLGLAARAGALVYGTDLVQRAIRAGRVHVVVVASDISENTREKLEPLLERRSIRWIGGLEREWLGAAVGRASLSAVGVMDAQLAKRLIEVAGVDDAGSTAQH